MLLDYGEWKIQCLSLETKISQVGEEQIKKYETAK